MVPAPTDAHSPEQPVATGKNKASGPLNVLFIGNSFTARNDLPALVAALAAAAGTTMSHRLISAGGASLRMHWNKGEAPKAIREGGYDYVVLQEQSTLPIKNAARFHENVRLFDEEIKAAGSKTVLYMTWARRHAPDSQRALTKLRSLGIEPREPVIGYAPRLRVRDAAFEPLRQALDRRQVVRFRYFKPGEAAPRERTVNPLAVVLHEGRWHLHAFDRDAQGPRTFLLSRIVGAVQPVPGLTFDAPPPGIQDRILAELDELRLQNAADLAVTAGSDAEVRLGKRAVLRDEDAGVIRLHYTDAAVFADELAAYGPEVRVMGPASLREAVRTRLEAVVAAHRNGGVA